MLFAVPVFLQADAPATPARQPNTPAEKSRLELIKRFDKNGDGRLDDEEKAAGKMAMKAGGAPNAGPRVDQGGKAIEQIMKPFDKDGDGQLNAEERAAFEQARENWVKTGQAPGPLAEKLREERIKRFDKDGDGALNEAEQAEAKKAADNFMKNGGGAKLREAAQKRFDKNADGQLDDEERAAMRAEFQKRSATPKPAE